MERIRANRSMCRASRGKCSLILMPGTVVLISRKGPPLAWPGFKSKVSIWEGPPFIHNRMHERRGLGPTAAAVASEDSQPDIDQPAIPAADRLSQSRRDSSNQERDMGCSSREVNGSG